MKTAENIKIVMLANHGVTSRIIFHYLIQYFPQLEMIVESPPSRWKLLKNRAKRLGWLTVVGQLIFQTTIVPLLEWLSRQRKQAILTQYQLHDAPVPASKLRRVSSVNAAECHEILRNSQAHVILVNGTRIISPKTLACTDIPFVNTHLGITPQFRGVHGGYWAMATGREDCFGVTVHLVDAGVDTGAILQQVFCRPSPADNFATYPLLALAEALPTLKSVLLDVAHRTARIQLPAAEVESKQWYHPTIFQYLTYFLTRGIR